MPQNERVLLNVEITCRTCLKEKPVDDLRSLLDSDLSSLISEVASIQLHLSSSLPASICSDCFKDLNIAVDFRKKVHNAESFLKDFICQEKSDNMTVIYKTFTVLDSRVISECNIKEVIGLEVTENDDINQDAKDRVVQTFLKEDDNICGIINNISDETTESENYFISQETSDTTSTEIENIKLPDRESLKTDATSSLENNSQQNEDLNPSKGINEERFFKSTAIKRHHRTHNQMTQNKLKKFTCESCGKKFHLLGVLTKHKCHTGSGSSKCDVCQKKLSGSHSLRNHMKIHKGDKKHKCDICGSTFIHRFSLRAHMRTHTGEKPFACKLCKKTFSTSSYLKIHLRTHTAEKPYVCRFCLKKFISRCALAAHEKTHTGEKKYQCDFCGWRTSRSADLRTHIRKHTGEKPYCCSQCGKSFKTASNLAAHRKTHLGLKDHLCNICDKAFGDPRTLKSHIRIHTGETPYQCHVCGHRFKQSGQLSAHRKLHHIKKGSDTDVK